jgi:hypothetical protein
VRAEERMRKESGMSKEGEEIGRMDGSARKDGCESWEGWRGEWEKIAGRAWTAGSMRRDRGKIKDGGWNEIVCLCFNFYDQIC